MIHVFNVTYAFASKPANDTNSVVTTRPRHVEIVGELGSDG